MVQLVGILGGIAAAVPDGGGAAVGGLAGLHHKALFHPGKGQAVVIARLRQAHKVGAGLGRLLGKQYRPEHPRRRIEHSHRIPRRRVGELQFGRLDRFGAADTAAGGRAAPQASGQRKGQGRCQDQRGPFEFTRHIASPCIISYTIPAGRAWGSSFSIPQNRPPGEGREVKTAKNAFS